MSSTTNEPLISEGGNQNNIQLIPLLGLGQSVFKSLSDYSPVIIVMCIFFISIISTSEYSFAKPFIYLSWFFVATGIRHLTIYLSNKNNPSTNYDSGFEQFYSTYILSFTFFYLLFPLILVNMDANSSLSNYKSIIFFVVYIIYDLVFKVLTLSDGTNLLPLMLKSLGEFISGSAIGIALSSIMYYANKSLLYINELASNGSVSTAPKNQQMKCKVYKNGELIGHSEDSNN